MSAIDSDSKALPAPQAVNALRPRAGSNPTNSPAVQAEIPRQIHICPPTRWEWLSLGELWHYRELFLFLSWRDIKVRYKQTVIGAAWAILQPVLMMVVFTIFLGKMAGLSKGEQAYPLFVFAGLLPWTFFATAVSVAGNSVVGSEKLITKIYFPRIIIPVSAIGTALVDALLAAILLALLLIGYQVWPSPTWLMAPLLLVGIAAFAIGIGVAIAALNVSYRDFRYVIPFMIQLGMFATPAIYMPHQGTETSTLPAWLELTCRLNPMNSLIDGFRCALLNQPIPWQGVGVALFTAILILLLGCAVFRRMEHRFADIV